MARSGQENVLWRMTAAEMDFARAIGLALEVVRQRAVRDEVSDVRARLIEFREEHERRAEELSSMLKESGQEPPSYPNETRAFIEREFSDMADLGDSGQALKLLEENGKLVYRIYDEARGQPLPEPVKSVAERNGRVALEHLRYVENAVVSRAWESGAVRRA